MYYSSSAWFRYFTLPGCALQDLSTNASIDEEPEHKPSALVSCLDNPQALSLDSHEDMRSGWVRRLIANLVSNQKRVIDGPRLH